jgi:hypothetical protein
VTDNTLKKGEIKITVIAAGFGEQAIKRDDRKERAEIKTEAALRAEAASAKKQPVFSGQVSAIDNADEEWDIPAFIRKKMK